MKRYISILLALVVALCLSPSAAALVTLSRPEPGQFVYINADEAEVYEADFYLAAVSGAQRVGDDLQLSFDNARIELRGFFSGGSARRGLAFKGGERITAEDFDEDGNYLGEYFSGMELAKPGSGEKLTETAAVPLLVSLSRTGSTITRDRQPVYGALRAGALAAVEEYTANGGDDWNKISELVVEFDVEADESLSVRAERLTDVNGLCAVNVRPKVVWLADCETLVPLSAGRSILSFTNALGHELQSLSVCVAKSAAGFDVDCVCPSCGENQNCALHMLPCGHYVCTDGVDAAEHAVPECGYAGHCITDGEDHGTCKNCLKPLCDGQEHGFGICKHQHTWVQQSYTGPTATTNGESVSRCVTCGITYRQVLPAFG